MAKSARVVKIPDNHIPSPPVKPARRRNVPSPSPRTTIQISQLTRTILEQIKEMEQLETYDDAINFLFRERRRCLPSTFGCMPDDGPFEREEEEDPYRVPS
jgi:hypothetical protein